LNATRGAKPFPRGKIIFREGDPSKRVRVIYKYIDPKEAYRKKILRKAARKTGGFFKSKVFS
jgi:hypothetical protein